MAEVLPSNWRPKEPFSVEIPVRQRMTYEGLLALGFLPDDTGVLHLRIKLPHGSRLWGKPVGMWLPEGPIKRPKGTRYGHFCFHIGKGCWFIVEYTGMVGQTVFPKALLIDYRPRPETPEELAASNPVLAAATAAQEEDIRLGLL